MRIAYCISGFSRVYRDTLPLFEKNIWSVLRKDHDLDIFFSTWKLTDRGGYREWHENPYKEFEHVQNLTLDIEDNFEYNNRYLSDFYKRHRAYLQSLSGNYDFYFRDRMDSCHIRKFPVSEIDRSIAKNEVFVPTNNGWRTNTIFDWCAFGPATAMKNYFEVYSLLDDVPCEENIAKFTDKNEFEINDPEAVLSYGLKALNQPWSWSPYSIRAYDRHFGNDVHKRYSHMDENGEEYVLNTRTYK